MGYTTEFEGQFDVLEPVKKDFFNYINKFSRSRRMTRDPRIIKAIYPDWKLMCFNGKLGNEGEYFINSISACNNGQTRDASVMDYNQPPSSQPGLWCQWILDTQDDKESEYYKCSLKWDEGEKFYSYVQWLEYLITNFFEVEGYHLSGCVLAVGESEYDALYIIVDDNGVYTFDYKEDLSVLLNLTDNKELREKIKDCYLDPDTIESRYWNWDWD